MTDDGRVGTAPCGCGLFNRDGNFLKVHDGKCEFAEKKHKKEKHRPEAKKK